MDISKKHKKPILDEIDFILSKMENSNDAVQKTYYFSGVHTLINRLLNMNYDANLLFVYHIFKSTHDAFTVRMQAMNAGEMTIPLADEHFEKLEFLIKQFEKNLEEDQDIYSTLREFVELFYSTTGNGHYLKEKGLLKI